MGKKVERDVPGLPEADDSVAWECGVTELERRKLHEEFMVPPCSFIVCTLSFFIVSFAHEPLASLLQLLLEEVHRIRSSGQNFMEGTEVLARAFK